MQAALVAIVRPNDNCRQFHANAGICLGVDPLRNLQQPPFEAQMGGCQEQQFLATPSLAAVWLSS